MMALPLLDTRPGRRCLLALHPLHLVCIESIAAQTKVDFGRKYSDYYKVLLYVIMGQFNHCFLKILCTKLLVSSKFKPCMINFLTFGFHFIVWYVDANFGCFLPIKHEAAAPMVHISFLRHIGGYRMRIQVRNLFARFLSLWFRKKLDIRRQALFKTPKFRI